MSSSSPFWKPIEPSNVRELMNSGYCVIDNFMQDETVAKKMREEMCSMPIRYENEEEKEVETDPTATAHDDDDLSLYLSRERFQ